MCKTHFPGSHFPPPSIRMIDSLSNIYLTFTVLGPTFLPLGQKMHDVEADSPLMQISSPNTA